MSWLALDLEVRSELHAHSGGFHYDRLVDAMWLGVLVERERERLRGEHRRSSAITRGAWNRTRKAWRERAKRVTVAVRCCPICGSMYERKHYESAEGRRNGCSPACRRLASGRWPLFKIGRRRDTLSGWAKRFGADTETVRHRVQSRLATRACPGDASDPARQAAYESTMTPRGRCVANEEWTEEELDAGYPWIVMLFDASDRELPPIFATMEPPEYWSTDLNLAHRMATYQEALRFGMMAQPYPFRQTVIPLNVHEMRARQDRPRVLAEAPIPGRRARDR